jgi:hypothetical protein
MKKAIFLNVVFVLTILLIVAEAQPPVVQASMPVSSHNDILGETSAFTSPSLTIARCDVIYSHPDEKVSRGADFQAVWKVKNTADKKWKKTDVDYKYISGKKTNRSGYKSIYDFPNSVKPGDTIKIRVNMTAPSKKGTYYTKWAIVLGGKKLCSLPLTIRVR